jgi:hypothetical protein
MRVIGKLTLMLFKFSNGVIIGHDHHVITVRFISGDKKQGLLDAFINKLMITENAGITAFFEHLAKLLVEEQSLKRDLNLAIIEFGL